MERYVVKHHSEAEYRRGMEVFLHLSEKLNITKYRRWQYPYFLDIFTAIQSRVDRGIYGIHRVCCQGANGVGKTYADALLCLMLMAYVDEFLPDHGFFGQFYSGKVDQSEESFMSHVGKAVYVHRLQRFFSVTSHAVTMPGNPLISTKVGAFRKENVGQVKGGHNDFRVVFADECNLIPDDVCIELQRVFTDCFGMYLLTSNPVSLPGFFYDRITDDAGVWDRYMIGRPDQYAQPGEIPDGPNDSFETDEFAIATRAQYGEDSQQYIEWVLGKTYGITGAEHVFPDYYLKGACARTAPTLEGPYTLVIDVAKGANANSDHSVIWVENRYTHVAIYRKITPYKDFVRRVLEEWIPGYQPLYIILDYNSYGLGLGTQVVEQFDGHQFPNNGGLKTEVILHVGSERAERDDKYANRRTEAYCRLANRIEHYYCIDTTRPGVKTLLEELRLIKRGHTSVKEKTVLEAKTTLPRSPDIADCMAMATRVSLTPTTTYRPAKRKSIYDTPMDYHVRVV